MKTFLTFLKLLCAVALATAWAGKTRAADTAGIVTFNVQLYNAGGSYQPKHVVAVWVTNQALGYIKCLWKDGSGWTGEGTTHLDRLKAARGASTVLDGHTASTITSYNPFTVNWDCSNATKTALVPDGTYYFFVEFTERNSAGPYSGALAWTKGPAPFSTTYPDQAYIKNMSLTFTPAAPPHDIAVTAISPGGALTNTLVNLQVVVTNETTSAETNITVTVSNLTSVTLLGTQTIPTLAANTSTTLTFPWNTAGLPPGGYSLKASASPVTNETATADNTFTRTFTLMTPTHDVAVAAIAAPAQVSPGSATNVVVTVTNKGGLTESFAVVLSDLTDSRDLGTNQVNSLASLAGTTVTIPWTVPASNLGAHILRAVAGPVAEETATADNTNQIAVLVMPSAVVTTYLTKSNYWRYNDTGANLGTAWRQTNYNDTAWSYGRGPMGYGDPPTNTALYFGPDGNNKYPTYYFRSGFHITGPLPTNFTMNLRRDDGAVVYHNGVEVYRVFMTNYPVYYTNYADAATGTVGGADETNYFQISLPVTNSVSGSNVIAVEVHQVSATSSDLSFDLELIGTSPPQVPNHDVAVRSIGVPAQVIPGTTTNITVAVTNEGTYVESFTVVLTDDTDTVAIGTSEVSNLGTNAAVNLVFPWLVPGTPFVSHTLRAVAWPVLGEAGTADNTNMVTVLVSPLMETNVLITRSNYWRYNDTGTDLTFTPWKQTDYYDGAWALGQGSLGYGDPHTTIIRSNLPPSTDKLPTYYFRKSFHLDALPSFLTLRLRRDDGAVVHHNGVEVHRVNLTNNPVYYTNWASGSVDGAAETTYYESALPLTNAVLGLNVLAVEVHQVNATSSDVSFDAELLSANPAFTRVHDVTVAGLATPGDALAGDRLPVTITLTNRGNATETALLVLKDTLSGQTVGSRTLAALTPGGVTTAQIDWGTLGAASGAHTLQAYTVINGVTNFAGAFSAPATISGSGIGLQAVNAAGAIAGRCSAISASGTLLLVGAGATLEVWDRTNPVLPVKLGAVRLPGMIQGLATSSSYAYAACGSAGVQFVNLAVPASPVHVNTFNSSGHAHAVTVNGSYLYVADGVAGLRILNISNPAAPVLTGVYYTEGPARAVTVSLTRAYVLDQHKGLLILSVASPSAPSLMGAYTGCDAGVAVAVSGNYAYILDANNHLQVVNIVVPSATVLTGSLLLPNTVGQAMVLNGTTVYVAAGDNGLLTINAATPSAPALVSTLATPGPVTGLSLAGSTLYLANGFAGFQVLDVTTPASPALQLDLPMALRASDVAVVSNLAVVASGETGLRIFSLANPAAPVLLGHFTGALNPRCVAVAGSLAYVGDGQYGLKVVSIADPAHPALVASFSHTNFASIRSLGVCNDKVVFTDGRKIGLLDVRTPANPILRDTETAPGFAFGLAAADDVAYVACGEQGVLILDTYRFALSFLGFYDTPGLATGVAVSDYNLFVADGPAGWLMLDVSYPGDPLLVTTSSAQGPAFDVAATGLIAILGDGASSLRAVDASLPLTPVPLQNFGGLVRALRVAATPSLALAAEDEAGLAVFLSPNDLDQDGLPDWWEQQIVNVSQATNGPIHSVADVLPGADFDRDGLSNYAEYLAGTSPINPNSRLVLQAPAVADGTPVTVRWASVPGKTYTLWKTLDLKAGFFMLQDNILADQAVTTYTDNAPGGSAFYMVTLP